MNVLERSTLKRSPNILGLWSQLVKVATKDELLIISVDKFIFLYIYIFWKSKNIRPLSKN